MSDWAHPDFTDSRFKVEHVKSVYSCRHVGCGRRADFVVEYSMRRDGWTYDYEAAYCADHLPDAARARLS